MKHFKYFGELQEKFSDRSDRPDKAKAKFTERPKEKKKIANLTGVVSANDMMDMTFDTIDFTGDWQVLLGNPSPSFDMLVHGEPGSGKTTFLLKFAKYLSLKFGRVLYVSSEEFGSTTLVKMLKDLEIASERLFFANDLSGGLDEYDFVIVDSVNDIGMTMSDFKVLREEHPLTAFLLVLQHTKSGDYRGGKDWEHEVEIGAEVVEGIVTVYRNRYGVKGSLNIFEPISSEPRKGEDKDDN
jgi:predicted ATP-dependent serine protease